MADSMELMGKPLEELEKLFQAEGKERFRARQVYRWLYRHLEADFERMTDLSKEFRESLKEKYCISILKPEHERRSLDGTVKFLYSLEDGEGVEAVMIPDEGRRTLCVSTQAGCRMGCLFCASGIEGYSRSLSSAEIIGQVCHVEKYLRSGDERITNVVFMGMGEPLDNLEELLKSISILRSVLAFSISGKKITVSTCGLLPQLKELIEESDVSIAVSLNGSDDDTRSRIMPVNRVYPIAELMGFLKGMKLKPGRKVTIEYVLMKGVNDGEKDASRLADLIKNSRIKVNLIPFNVLAGTAVKFEAPEAAVVERFRKVLLNTGVQVITRSRRGADIESACGQLKGKLLKRNI